MGANIRNTPVLLHKLYPSKSIAVNHVVISLRAPRRFAQLSPNVGSPSAWKIAAKYKIQLVKSSCFSSILSEKFFLRVKFRRRTQAR